MATSSAPRSLSPSPRGSRGPGRARARRRRGRPSNPPARRCPPPWPRRAQRWPRATESWHGVSVGAARPHRPPSRTVWRVPISWRFRLASRVRVGHPAVGKVAGANARQVVGRGSWPLWCRWPSSRRVAPPTTTHRRRSRHRPPTGPTVITFAVYGPKPVRRVRRDRRRYMLEHPGHQGRAAGRTPTMPRRWRPSGHPRPRATLPTSS